MFVESVKEDLLRMKDTLRTDYINFYNDGTTSKDNGEFVLSSTNDSLNHFCSGIDNFLKDGTKAMSLTYIDFDELNFIFRFGVIYGKNTLGENNEILPTSKCLNNKVRYYTESVEAYKDGKLVKEISNDIIMGYQGFIDYDKFIKDTKKEKISVTGPKSFEELKDNVINNKKEKISLSINFENNKEKSIDNELKTTDTNHKPKTKIRSLF